MSAPSADRHCDPRGVSRLRQLVDLAHGYEPHATQRPGDFLQFIDANPAVRPASARVRVMTIHHSKGLEFDVVFLTELNQSRLVQNPDYVTGHPSPVELPNAVIRYTREEVQRLLPDNLQAVFRENFERKVEEQLCVLYVALTRARHALHLVMRPADGPVKSSNMAGLLRAALADGGALPPLTRLTISGDPDWIRQLPAPSGPAPSPAAETAPLRITLAPPRAGDLFAQQALRPSAHATGHLRLRQLLQPDNAGAMTRGTLIHAWCEKIDWLDETAPDLDRFRQIAARLEPQFEALEPTLAEFQRMLKRPNIAQLFSRAAYLDPRGLLSVPLRGRQSPPEFQVRTHAERRFVVRMDDQLVRGCIDRLVLIQQDQQVVAADIVDFKTDVLEDLARPVASQRLSDYREQLRLYVRAVSHLYDLPVEQIGARLVFLASGKIEVVAASSSRRSARTASDVPDDSNG